MQYKISKSEWEQIGLRMNWIKSSQKDEDSGYFDSTTYQILIFLEIFSTTLTTPPFFKISIADCFNIFFGIRDDQHRNSRKIVLHPDSEMAFRQLDHLTTTVFQY